MNKRINILLQLVFIAAITLALWNGVEGVRLNQRYERSIEGHERTAKQYEQGISDYLQYLERTKQQIQERIDKKG
jgi:DNA gyrase/topoisomerase IV subunit B